MSESEKKADRESVRVCKWCKLGIRKATHFPSIWVHDLSGLETCTIHKQYLAEPAEPSGVTMREGSNHHLDIYHTAKTACHCGRGYAETCECMKTSSNEQPPVPQMGAAFNESGVADMVGKVWYVKAKLGILIPLQIKALRIRANMSQSELSEAAEIHQSRISFFESPGTANLTIDTLAKLAAVFKAGLIVKFVSLPEMLEWENSYQPATFPVAPSLPSPSDRDRPGIELGVPVTGTLTTTGVGPQRDNEPCKVAFFSKEAAEAYGFKVKVSDRERREEVAKQLRRLAYPSQEPIVPWEKCGVQEMWLRVADWHLETVAGLQADRDGWKVSHDQRLKESLETAIVISEMGARCTEKLERERDLAVAHDRQPYPTAEAYEAVCAARNKWQTRAEAAESQVAVLRAEILKTRDMIVKLCEEEGKARNLWTIFETLGAALTPSPESTEGKQS